MNSYAWLCMYILVLLLCACTNLIYVWCNIDEDGYFGQEQVPLTDEIKEILEEYPDGQIFKVNDSALMYIS